MTDLTDTIKKILPFFAILLLAAVFSIYVSGKEKDIEEKQPIETSLSEIVPYDPVTENDLDTSEDGALPVSPQELKSMGPLKGGAYILSGEYDATVEIDAQDEIVKLILDNADIRTYDGPAVLVRSAAKVIITSKEGTDNTLADCAYYSLKEAYASVFSYADLTFNGSGRLTVSGFLKDAVYTSGSLKVIDTEFKVKAKRCALDSDDGMLLMPAAMTAEAEKTGLKSGIHKKIPKGSIYILGGNNTIVAGNTAVYSGRDLYIASCKVSINAVVSDIQTQGEQYIEEGCL